MFTPWLVVIFETAMLVTLLSGLATAAWLWRQRDLRPLAGFVAGMGLWCLGHFLGPLAPALALPLLLANPFMPNAFLHFALGYLRVPPGQKRRLLWASYGTSVLVFAISLIGGASIQPWPPFEGFIRLAPLGWLNLGWTVALGVSAHLVLLRAYLKQQGNVRRSILAIFLVGGWGLLLASSFVFPSLGIPYFPYSMLALPSYVLLLVFAVLRYRMLEVNLWASRILLWLALALVAGALSALAAGLGFARSGWALWGYSLLILAASALLYPLLNAWVRRLVYPGAKLDETLLSHWRSSLRDAHDWPALLANAECLLQTLLGRPLPVTLEPARGPHLLCRRQQDGWQAELKGGEELLPGQRLQLEVFASLLGSACDNLERTLALAAEERKRLDQQHLVELGALSAAMAHELRNPLNIIAMAAVRTEERSRHHIQEQLKRADRLIQDLLTYGSPLEVRSQPVALLPLLQSLPQAAQVELAVPPELVLETDPHRLTQLLVNLLDNALAFAATKVRLEAEGNLIRVHNDGPPIPSELAGKLFRPFVSKRPGGSGLGLAIVRRIMAAQGGSVRHRADLGWPVTFELEFPL
ncbi:ATP-binding protein [Gallaecimonas kandeliae]|uniref:sensor histidine kinase n=1 Tax=Gallaecimonas kandeliae TaxID=3029055 RepID=UPI0026488EF6|nr:sensor histidine kinase [Gallaecimonas kandeliae]WKE65226.1 ATP-binding protein [Gallaecimonas kandeliae]